MISYKDVLNDSKIKEYIDMIDRNNNFYMSHGKNHINSLICIIDKFLELVDINENDKNNLYISAIFHDIGRAFVGDNHSLASSKLAKEYLSGKLNDNDINIICNIIKNHGWKNKKENLLENILCFCDKVDFSVKRLEDYYSEKYGFKSVLEDIKNIEFNIVDDSFIFKICTNGNIVFEDILKEKKNYDIGIQYNVSVIANVLNLKRYLIYFDDLLLYSGNQIFEIDKYIK